MSLILFDIDGTLLLSGGAGIRAMTRAFEDVFGVANAFDSADVAGRTDTFLVSAALRRFGFPDTVQNRACVRAAYIRLLHEEILRPPQGKCGLMPGIQPLLATLHDHDSMHLALLTGNFEHAAYTKLRRFGIDSFFAWGAFGEESSDRRELARVARRRAEERHVPAAARERTIVIGDTPHDITCARAIDARTIAVATGNFSVEQLRDAGADVALPDLSDTPRVFDVIAASV